MSVGKRLFVGCGDGRELLSMAGLPGIILVGIEPIQELYQRAVNNLIAFPGIKLFNCRIQELRLTGKGTGFDRIYMVFPTPKVLEMEGEELARKLYELLSMEQGVLELYSEVDLKAWPDPEDRRRLEDFLDSLRQRGFHTVTKTVDYEELPEYVRASECSNKLREHGIMNYTFAEAIKIKG